MLDGLDLDVPGGSIYGLVGPNGVGKTTTIKVLMNILGPSSGRSEVLEADSRRLGPRQFAQIGYVSENQEMPEWMTVRVFPGLSGAVLSHVGPGARIRIGVAATTPVDRKLKHLSHGMRMKASLASSLAYRPKLIVLDEPFTGLDALVRDELIEGLLARAEGTTIFISSHDLTEIESFASHIGYLDQHKLQFSEELESLSARFHEISMTFDTAPPLPADWPAKWLQPETAGAVIRFIDTRFDADRTPGEIRSMFPTCRDISATGMPLRSIFVTLAKASRGVSQ